MKCFRLIFGIFLAFSLALGSAHLWAQAQRDTVIDVDGQFYVNTVGNGRFRVKYTFSPPRAYDRIKRNYPNLYVLFRDLGVQRGSLELVRNSLNVTSDDAQRTITFVGDIYGVVVNRDGKWYMELPRDEKIVTRAGNRIFTSIAETSDDGSLLKGKLEYALPGNAEIVEYAPDRQLLSYRMPAPKGTGKPELKVQLRAKRRIMSALHKVYAESELDSGRHWVGKVLVKNTGTAPVYDLRVIFKLGEYTERSVPQRFGIVPPGGAAVAAYYPVISRTVSSLRSRTPAELRVTYAYKDAAGRTFTDEIGEKVDILGINEFEHSNLSDDEKTDNWFDHFNNSDLLAAFVMKNDEAVRQFAGIVSDAAGGVASARSPREAMDWLKAAYDQLMRNGISYQSPNGFMTVDMTSGQDLKYPRDVFREKSGTCIDLAILYASLAEAVGMRSFLVLIPGHCFAMVEIPGGQIVKVENTGIGTEKRLTFEQAMRMADEEFAQAEQDGRLLIVDVRKALSQGMVSPPELPALPPDFLAKLGYRRR